MATELHETPFTPLKGIDEEKTLRKAIKAKFPDSKLLTCTRYLKNNSTRQLSDKIGATEKERNHVIKAVFGPQGLTSADDSITFHH